MELDHNKLAKMLGSRPMSIAQLGAENLRLKNQASALKDGLQLAWSDIQRWIQLARYQREQMDQNLGWCPTEAGIEESLGVLNKISNALAAVAQSQHCSDTGGA